MFFSQRGGTCPPARALRSLRAAYDRTISQRLPAGQHKSDINEQMGDAIGTHGDRLFLGPSRSPSGAGTGLGDVASHGEPRGAWGRCRSEARVPPTSIHATAESPVSGLGGFCLCAGFTVCSLFLAFFYLNSSLHFGRHRSPAAFSKGHLLSLLPKGRHLLFCDIWTCFCEAQ